MVAAGKAGAKEGILLLQGGELGADAEEPLEVRVHRVPRRTLALLDDRGKGGERCLETTHLTGTRKVDLLRCKLQRRISAESNRLAVALHERTQSLTDSFVEDSDRVVVSPHRGEVRARGAARVGSLAGKTRTLHFGRAVRTLEEYEVLQRIGPKGRELHGNTGRQIPGIEREVGTADAWTRAERRGEVPDGHQVTHLLDGDVHQHAAPALHRLSLGSGESLRLALLETRGGVEVRAHQVVLELGRFVQRIDQDLALQERARVSGVVHAMVSLQLQAGMPVSHKSCGYATPHLVCCLAWLGASTLCKMRP